MGVGIVYQGKYDHGAKKNNTTLSAFKLWNVAVKATPKSGVSVAHTQTKQQSYNDKNNSMDQTTKTNTKFGWKLDDLKLESVMANDKGSIKFNYPLSKDDWKVDGEFLCENKPGKSRKFEGSVAIESPDMGNANVVANIKASQEMKGADLKAEDPKVSVEACVTVDKDWHIGFAAEHNTKDMSDIEAVVVKRDGDSKYWLGYDHDNEQVKAGCLQFCADKNYTHAYEARYNTKGEANGFMGQPMKIAAGGKYVLSKASTLNYMMEFGAQHHTIMKWEHKVDKNWKVAVNQSYDLNNVGKEKAGDAYQLGMDVSYTL